MAVAPGAAFPLSVGFFLPWNGGMAPWPYSYIQYRHAVVPRDMTAGGGDLTLERVMLAPPAPWLPNLVLGLRMEVKGRVHKRGLEKNRILIFTNFLLKFKIIFN